MLFQPLHVVAFIRFIFCICFIADNYKKMSPPSLKNCIQACLECAARYEHYLSKYTSLYAILPDNVKYILVKICVFSQHLIK